MKIKNKSSFTIDVELEDEDGIVIDPSTVDFLIEFFTNTTILSCSRIDGELTNCRLNGDTIVCLVDEFDFKFTGELKARSTIYYNSTDFPDGQPVISQDVITEAEIF